MFLQIEFQNEKKEIYKLIIDSINNYEKQINLVLIPNHSIKKNCWINLIIDLTTLFNDSFKLTLNSIIIGKKLRLRSIFTC